MKTIYTLVLLCFAQFLYAQSETVETDTIRLEGMGLFSYPTESKLMELLQEEKANFIVFSLMQPSQENLAKFKEAYGVGIQVRGCVLTPYDLAESRRVNQQIANYLHKKHGKTWIEKLPITPSFSAEFE